MNVYEQLGITPIINAAGTLTHFGGSLMHPEVTDAMAAASRSFVDMHELQLAAGKQIAAMLGVEAVHVCNGAAAGIALMAAACMAGADPERITRLPDTSGMRSEFVVQRAHMNAFTQALRVAGGQITQIASDAEELEKTLSESTAAVFYTFAWFCPQDALPLPEVVTIARRAGVPVIVDAAAEIPPAENLSRFVEEGADLVTFSGGKALRGPQASGLILGRRELIEACRLNDCPNMSVGRSMKTGKEEIIGLVKAVELYVATDHFAEMAVWERRVQYIMDGLSELEHVQVRKQLPVGLGQQIPHVALDVDAGALQTTCEALVQRLLTGRPRVAVQLVSAGRDGSSTSTTPEIRVHPHTLREGEEAVLVRRLREELFRAARTTN